MSKFKVLTSALVLTVAASGAMAQTYTAASYGPLTVRDIYVSEGSSNPYMSFVEQFDPACYDGRGAYMFNLTTTGTAQAKNFVMAVVLTAKTTGKRVSISYMRGGPTNSWGACYLTGVHMVE